MWQLMVALIGGAITISGSIIVVLFKLHKQNQATTQGLLNYFKIVQEQFPLHRHQEESGALCVERMAVAVIHK